MAPQKCLKMLKFIKIDSLWACRNIGRHGRIILVEYGPWGLPGDPSYDHLCVPCYHPSPIRTHPHPSSPIFTHPPIPLIPSSPPSLPSLSGSTL